MHQILRFWLLMAFVANMFLPPSVSAQMFGDNTYQQAVAALQSADIIDRGSIDSMRLSQGVNRAEALKVILRGQPNLASSVPSIAHSMPPLSLFSDVDQRAWFAPYIEVAFRSRLITGYPDGSFHPQGGVTVEEAAAMITRSSGDATSSASFLTSDDLPNQQHQWYTSALSVLLSKNAVMQGSRFHVGQLLSRGQLFDLVYRMRLAHGAVSQQPVLSVSSPLQPAKQVYVPTDNDASGSVQIVQDAAALQYASSKPFAVSIPSLGITDLTITHPADPYSQDGVLSVLKDGVGHLFSYPGEGSKVLIYGHSSGYPWDLSKYTKIFRGINKITLGAHIYVTYAGKLFVYQVTEKKTIPAKDRTAFESAEKTEELILYTCWPPDSITQRYLVHAIPVETIALK